MRFGDYPRENFGNVYTKLCILEQFDLQKRLLHIAHPTSSFGVFILLENFENLYANLCILAHYDCKKYTYPALLLKEGVYVHGLFLKMPTGTGEHRGLSNPNQSFVFPGRSSVCQVLTHSRASGFISTAISAINVIFFISHAHECIRHSGGLSLIRDTITWISFHLLPLTRFLHS